MLMQPDVLSYEPGREGVSRCTLIALVRVVTTRKLRRFDAAVNVVTSKLKTFFSRRVPPRRLTCCPPALRGRRLPATVLGGHRDALAAALELGSIFQLFMSFDVARDTGVGPH
jgi:hypothetical protein